MSDELPAGDKAVYVFLEIIAFCFALAFVDALVAQKAFALSLRWLLLALFFFSIWRQMATDKKNARNPNYRICPTGALST